MKKRTMTLVISLLLVALVAVGGTLAWLMDGPKTVINTFTAGDVNIKLTETTQDYKMVPGNTIAKDPTVTVEADSEACWLFVKIDESANLDEFITYAVDEPAWTMLEEGVYYREVSAEDAKNGISYNVLKTKEGYTAGYVTVNGDVTKTQLDALTEATNPTLTFTAYAVQKDNLTVGQAWNVAQGLEPGEAE